MDDQRILALLKTIIDTHGGSVDLSPRYGYEGADGEEEDGGLVRVAIELLDVQVAGEGYGMAGALHDAIARAQTALAALIPLEDR
jgi:hypothetical protein